MTTAPPLWYYEDMGRHIDIDLRDIAQLEKDLGVFRKRALPYATRNTVNQSAFHAMREGRENIRASMITRNRWSEQSVRVNSARTLRVERQEATVGSTVDYMELQEFGGVKRAKGREGTPIPTSYSAGQGMSSRPRLRLPRRSNQIRNIRLSSRGTRGSRRQRNLIVIRQAVASGQKYVFLDLGRRKGLFRVVGGKRRPRVRMVHDLSRRSVRIPRNPWLRPAVDETRPRVPEFYAESLRFQIRRLRIFR